MASDRSRGFTLLELLVAMAVFSLLAAMAYGGLTSVLDARAHTDRAAERLDEMQLAFAMLQRDLHQVVDRPRRDAYGDRRPGLMLDDLRLPPRLELVSAGARSRGVRSELRRVGWELEDGVLYRLLWPTVDGGMDEPQSRVPMLGEVAGNTVEVLAFVFHYHGLDGERTTSRAWPPPEQPNADLPLAVEIELEAEHTGAVTRLFALPRKENDR
ncbi:type II secretion system minor pseudopilin GspJ [Alkalilimnicola ehrlichii MLHE-1]|uniref:Type II secretion system protein J n=1 Tax=Alkalilimnicola ehrlichii (strain ATCC BAA-1101 / DSM 17681 / MLHE-1) TaxID=187272 RepID=Q0A609_ALKEH|nr:type II secretion system minor pseudopilin GspJ [Alkalilimnicola ehrlichii]ABI57728.1 general secretion pathway protein J [Alkalilimnicola ehrlichii MLHE-1]